MSRDEAICEAYQLHSLSTVAKQFGLSPSRISQIVRERGANHPPEIIRSRQSLTQQNNFTIRWNAELDAEIRALRAQGLGNRRIGETLGFSEPTIAKRVRFLGLPPGVPFNSIEVKGIIC